MAVSPKRALAAWLRGSCVEGFEPALEFRMRQSGKLWEMRRRAGVNGYERRARLVASIRVVPPVSGPFWGMETGVLILKGTFKYFCP